MALDNLEKIRKKLYQPKTEFKNRPEKPKIFEPGRKPKKYKNPQWSFDNQKRPKDFLDQFLIFFRKMKKYLFLGFLALISLAILIVWHNFNSFNKNQVEFSIKGPEKITSGHTIIYQVVYWNKSKVDLKNASLIFQYPEGVQDIQDSFVAGSDSLIRNLSIGNIKKGERKIIEFRAKLIGLKGQTKYATAKLSYQPIDMNIWFENEDTLETTIEEVPLILEFKMPERINDGQPFDFYVHYLNNSAATFSRVRLKMVYPEGFTFREAKPKPMEGSYFWNLGSLGSQEEGDVHIYGVLRGSSTERKIFKCLIGVMDEREQFVVHNQNEVSVNLELPPLTVSQTINGSAEYTANIGEKLEYQITYKNISDVGIGPVTIALTFQTKALDFSRLKLINGSFSDSTKTITWNASAVPELEFLDAGEEGYLNFEVYVKDPLPIDNFHDKDFDIFSIVKIDSDNVPENFLGSPIGNESRLLVKVNSRLRIDAKGYYKEGPISNSGPIPPQVGKATTYTLVWELINESNDLGDVHVESYLPVGIQWTGKIEPANAQIEYDPGSGKVVWQIGDLPAATGILLPIKHVAFQVKLVPSINQVGERVTLIEQSTVYGFDKFTEKQISDTDGPVSTNLPDEPGITDIDGEVVR